MTDGFQVTQTSDTVTVVCESFTLVFDKAGVGISSFKYETSGTWHECVESGTTPPILFCPYFTIFGLLGNVLYPSGGYELEATALPWFVQVSQKGWLRNGSIPGSTDYEYEVLWSIWPSGRIYARMTSTNKSGSNKTFAKEAYHLNPADDPDITLGRDAVPNLNWFGFYSNNTGSGASDLSHDAIVAPWGGVLDQYGISGNTNRMYVESGTWVRETEITRSFCLALSVNGSWGDVTDSNGFQSRGDAVADDYLNADPLDGSWDAGDVLTGTIVDDGFDEGEGGYTVQPV